MKQITIDIQEKLLNELRLTSIHRQQKIDEVILAILKQYYETRGH